MATTEKNTPPRNSGLNASRNMGVIAMAIRLSSIFKGMGIYASTKNDSLQNESGTKHDKGQKKTHGPNLTCLLLELKKPGIWKIK